MNAPGAAATRCARTALALLILAELSGREHHVEAQSLPTATLAGRVTTEDGAGLPGITVRLESKSLQGVREISTSATGDFLAALLPAGEYIVTFHGEGNADVSRNVTLPAATTVRLDQRMDPAAVAESVEVAADAVTTASLAAPEIEANYEKHLVDVLPLDRSFRAIVLLAPGVTDNGPRGNVGATNDRNALMLSGAFSYSNLFLINGVVVNENLRGQPNDLFIEDAIEETTVSTGNISAEYGRFTGGVVNAITRSGGNDFHGSFRRNVQQRPLDGQQPVRPRARSRQPRDERHRDLRGDVRRAGLEGPHLALRRRTLRGAVRFRGDPCWSSAPGTSIPRRRPTSTRPTSGASKAS